MSVSLWNQDAAKENILRQMTVCLFFPLMPANQSLPAIQRYGINLPENCLYLSSSAEPTKSTNSAKPSGRLGTTSGGFDPGNALLAKTCSPRTTKKITLYYENGSLGKIFW